MRKYDELKNLSFGWFVTPKMIEEKVSFLDFVKHQRFGLMGGFALGFAIATIIILGIK